MFLNPQLFINNVIAAIRQVLYELMIEGIKYEKIGNKVYEIKLFEDNELEIYIEKLSIQY